MTAPKHDYYKALGVDKSASTNDIKRAYRTLIRLHHPDKVDGQDEQAQLLNEAYETLKDATKRANYDVLHATHFGALGRILQSSHVQKWQAQAWRLADTADAYLQKNGQTLLKNAWAVIERIEKTLHPHKIPTLAISPHIAKNGGLVQFNHRGKLLRTTLPKGLTTGQQITLTLPWGKLHFVINIQE